MTGDAKMGRLILFAAGVLLAGAAIITMVHSSSPGDDAILRTTGQRLVWLPLGDSITFGCGSTNQPGTDMIYLFNPNFTCPSDCGGYRTPTAQALEARGHTVTTMGTMESGPADHPRWIQHEGHPGWRIDMADAILPQSLASSPVPPDIITIHLGTNDCWQAPGGAYPEFDMAPAAPEDLAHRMEQLLSHIHSLMPAAHVFVSSIISDPGIGKPSVPECVAAFNSNLPGIVKSFGQKGMKITYVPMVENVLICGTEGAQQGATKCCSDQTHPVQAGYDDMATVWATSLAQVGF